MKSEKSNSSFFTLHSSFQTGGMQMVEMRCLICGEDEEIKPYKIESGYKLLTSSPRINAGDS